MLNHRLRHWPNIETTLAVYLGIHSLAVTIKQATMIWGDVTVFRSTRRYQYCKHQMSFQCRFNAGPPSAMLAHL